jgi:hypothetical protein
MAELLKELREAKLGEAWTDHPDPSGFMRAAHDENNALLVWWYNPSTGAFIKSKEKGYRHSHDLDKGNIRPSELPAWLRGRVFKYQDKVYLILYWPQKKNMTPAMLTDVFDKVQSSIDAPITRTIDDNGDDISSLFESVVLEKAGADRWNAK